MTKNEQDFHKAHFTTMAEHHAVCAKAEQATEDHATALEEHLRITDPVASEHHGAQAKAAKNRKESHVTAGEHCTDCVKAVGAMPVTAELPTTAGGPSGKAEGDRIQKLVDVVEALLKTTQPLPGGFRLVPGSDRPVAFPRTGQAPINKDEIEPALQNIVLDDNQAQG